ncbi:hypothetical protein BG006_006245 [Podila minutissima]|uniref:N-acetyltransferase domain-containing protein n=1 Tax=Podila minutissima TaxID=64525 RepID=A0A9P5SLG6_9FUNG|nr:hypothetical protein BG006_006245 [Podila minutissima]
MSDASWSPPLDVNTRTITTLSVIRARPEHLQAIHKIQLLAYPGRTDFHESEDVFRSKLEAYPAGNFIALATYSVVTDDDTSTWTQPEVVHEEDLDEEMKSADDDDGQGHEISVVEIEITEATTPHDSTTTTTTSTTSASSNPSLLDAHLTIVRAQTPDIVEGSDDDEEHARSHPHSSSHAPKVRSSLAQGSTTEQPSLSSTFTHGQQGQVEDEQSDKEEEAILFQWEKPVGYIFSHPYSRETATLHHVTTKTDYQHDGHPSSSSSSFAAAQSTASHTKRVRLDKQHDDQDTPSSSSESESDPFEHDLWMEQYFVHDCAIDPTWQGKGVASKLWKALEESLIPAKADAGIGAGGGGGVTSESNLVDTEEEESELSSEGESQQMQQQPHRKPRRHRHRRGKQHAKRRGAPNLKEILLVSVQGTKPFWQKTGGFEVVRDHDLDLSTYGNANEAFLMRKAIHF